MVVNTGFCLGQVAVKAGLTVFPLSLVKTISHKGPHVHNVFQFHESQVICEIQMGFKNQMWCRPYNIHKISKTLHQLQIGIYLFCINPSKPMQGCIFSKQNAFIKTPSCTHLNVSFRQMTLSSTNSILK